MKEEAREVEKRKRKSKKEERDFCFPSEL